MNPFLTSGELRSPRAYLRALLILGRTSNLPTVWSNCIAAWILGGAGRWSNLLLLLLGATALYLGGMFLNDAYDAAFDRAHRPERPIPQGAMTEREVWEWGWGWLIGGMVPFLFLGGASAILAAILVAAIVLYDAVHKVFVLSPLLMGFCRFLLYVLGSSAGENGVAGLAVWGGLALAAYVVGLSYLARRESTGVGFQNWPLLLLATPVVLALLVNAGEYRIRAWFAIAILAAWVIHCVREVIGTHEPRIGRAVSGLLAGMVLVDMLMVLPAAAGAGLLFLLLFFTALAFQRHVPAT